MNLNRILRSYVLPLINRRCYASRFNCKSLLLVFNNALWPTDANGVTPNINSFVADRTVTCGQLGKSDVGRKVKLCGWIQFQRMNNFVILRDAYGLTQLIVPAEVMIQSLMSSLRNFHFVEYFVQKIDMAETLARLPFESVISVVGKVAARPAGQENKVQTVFLEVMWMTTDTLIFDTVMLCRKCLLVKWKLSWMKSEYFLHLQSIFRLTSMKGPRWNFTFSSCPSSFSAFLSYPTGQGTFANAVSLPGF